jgi:hypothetical protein
MIIGRRIKEMKKGYGRIRKDEEVKFTKGKKKWKNEEDG